MSESYKTSAFAHDHDLKQSGAKGRSGLVLSSCPAQRREEAAVEGSLPFPRNLDVAVLVLDLCGGNVSVNRLTKERRDG